MKKTAEVAKETTVDIVCDICGKSVVPDAYRALQNNLSEFQDFAVLHASFGYGSSRDGEKVHFDLCEACFETLAEYIEKLKRV
ncbi:hypothetical protein CWE13_07450 [Aliidiomarina shirensis]|uniref:Uncharacterized protein n=1 Tax=Aliidiomarina shirensis TaxID=1048642 RepID=A0A432WVH9_9GAMM|nr:hypothetical protein [Aliidiomarina shirensis]RUO37771.1 hypothetical protein CWE13_07450 [Aliidiomarina shirensis]